MVCSNLSIQQLYANQTGIDGDPTRISTGIIQKMTNDFIKGLQIQSKFIQTCWDTSRQTIKKINSNAEILTELNKNFINFSMRVWNPKKT